MELTTKNLIENSKVYIKNNFDETEGTELIKFLNELIKNSINIYYAILSLKRFSFSEKDTYQFVEILHQKDSPRSTYASLFNKYLTEQSKDGSLWKLAIKIEQGCFIESVRRAKSSDIPITCSWKIKDFYSMYCERCGTIAVLLKQKSTVPSKLAMNIINGTIDPTKIGSMDETELNTSALQKEREIVEKRLNQKLDIKTSNIYTCPRCKEKKCTYEVVQRRAADEAPDTICTCTACGYKFKA